MKKIILRKNRQCDYCFDALSMKRGMAAFYEQGRLPKFDANEKQVGVEFYKNYACATCNSEFIAEKDNENEDVYYAPTPKQ